MGKKKFLKKIDKSLAVFIGSEDEQFIPEEVIAYVQHCKNQRLIAEIVPGSKHLSIILDASRLFAGALKTWGFTGDERN